WEALYADRVPAAQRGLASGLKSLTEILAVLVGRLAAGELMAAVPLHGQAALLAAMAVPSLGLLLALLFTWLGMRDEPFEQGEPVREPLLKTYIDSFRFDWRAQHAFRWWFLNRFLFWVAFVTLSQFL